MVRELQLPVAIAPQGYPGSPSGIRRVTCTFDGSDASREALRMATVLAQVLDAEVRVATTTPPPLTEEETITRREPLVDPLLEEGCALVTEWSGADTIATPEPDWAMRRTRSRLRKRGGCRRSWWCWAMFRVLQTMRRGRGCALPLGASRVGARSSGLSGLSSG
ncbi:MAG: universal stress protein [Lawsonella clevelandensis]